MDPVALIELLAAESQGPGYIVGRILGTLLIPALIIGLIVWLVRRNKGPKYLGPPPDVVPPPGAVPPPGWHPDPHGQARLRYWDGAQWTEHTQT